MTQTIDTNTGTIKLWKREDITDEIVCRAMREAHKRCGDVFHVLLEKCPGCPQKVIECAIARTIDHGLADFKSNIRYAWLTTKGKAYIDGSL